MSQIPNLDLLTQAMLQNAPKTPQDMRRLLDGFAPFMNGDLPEVGALHESVTVGDGMTADVIVPPGAGPHPVLVYLHGGGWVCGSPRTHRKLAHRFAEAGYLVFNVDYRLAPEHPFPTPFEDCLAAVRFAHREAARFGGDPRRLAIGGDSAGGNLSAAVAAELAADPARPKAALLIYGVFDFAMFGGASMAAAVTGGAADPRGVELGERMVEMMVGAYLGAGGAREALVRDPRVSPLAVAAKLPPCHVVVGSADPLAAQSEALVKALSAAGVAHEHFVDEGMPHGYAQMEFLPAARPAIARMVEFLHKHV
ncbi:MAG TPA: alpha/beta hydrolase [Myxococcota bacterium]|nr:alpha/beta hydrolase [Myxococcota bacterium]